MKNRLVLIVLTVFCLGFLGASVALGWKLTRQVATAGWPAAAQGEVVESHVKTRSGSKGGVLYGAEVKYRYKVRAGDAWRDGSTVSISGEIDSSGGGFARETVAKHPVGPATVYVNPADPGEAVLEPGMGDHQWAMVGFMAPFLCVPFTILCGVVNLMGGRGRGRVGTVRVFEPALGVWVARASAWGPFNAAIMVLLPASIVTLVSTMVAPGSWAPWCVWASGVLCAAGMVLVFVKRRRWLAQGRTDTVIDANARVLIPARGKSPTAEVLPLKRVTGTKLLQDRPGTEKNPAPWHVHVAVDGEKEKGGKGTRRIAEIWERDDAAAFERWLGERIDAARGRDGRTAAGGTAR